jgi:acyl-CoA reductase-like NAD-dependent aldehyde dehydrogenase
VASEVLNNFVNGEYAAAAASETTAVVDPSTGEEYARAPVSGPADVEAALRAAAGAFESWRETTPAERSLALLRMADAVQARAAEIVAAECRNTGKPVGLTMAEEIPPLGPPGCWPGPASPRTSPMPSPSRRPHIPFVSEMPHGGFKHSGYGKDLSMYGFEDYTRIKHVMSYLGE